MSHFLPPLNLQFHTRGSATLPCYLLIFIAPRNVYGSHKSPYSHGLSNLHILKPLFLCVSHFSLSPLIRPFVPFQKILNFDSSADQFPIHVKKLQLICKREARNLAVVHKKIDKCCNPRGYSPFFQRESTSRGYITLRFDLPTHIFQRRPGMEKRMRKCKA